MLPYGGVWYEVKKIKINYYKFFYMISLRLYDQL
jgi:hypothetical protein